MSQLQSVGNQEVVMFEIWKSPVKNGAIVMTINGTSDIKARMKPAVAPFLSPLELIIASEPKMTAPTTKERRVSGTEPKAGIRPCR
jgi:hypothetical protein